jgi:hypothetical protein
MILRSMPQLCLALEPSFSSRDGVRDFAAMSTTAFNLLEKSVFPLEPVWVKKQCEGREKESVIGRT